MGTVEEIEPFDSIAQTLGIVGDRWTLLVLRDVFRGTRRFDDLCRDLAIARPVLSDRLAKLVAAGILDKIPYQQRPTRHEYRLTDMGRELSPALVALMHWGDRWLAHDRARVALTHGTCGTEIEQGFWCTACKTTVAPRAIRSRPVSPAGGTGGRGRGDDTGGAGGGEQSPGASSRDEHELADGHALADDPGPHRQRTV